MPRAFNIVYVLWICKKVKQKKTEMIKTILDDLFNIKTLVQAEDK